MFIVVFPFPCRKYSLKKIVAVEGKQDGEKGARYLLELELYDKHESRSVRLVEYVFRDASGHMWFPEGFKWRRNATVYFILPVKNQAKWVIYFVEEMTKFYERTGDGNFHLVIMDFESTDGDINGILKNSHLGEKYTLLRKSGAFHKTLAIQDAVQSVSDPNGIVFLFDLHITLPFNLLDSIRKVSITLLCLPNTLFAGPAHVTYLLLNSRPGTL